MSKFIKRKFLYPIFYAGFVVLSRKLELGLSLAELALIASTVSAFILGESYVDSKQGKGVSNDGSNDSLRR